MLSTTDHAITQVTKAQTPCMYSWSFKLSALTRHWAAYYTETYKRRPLAPRLRASIMFNQSEHRAPPTSKPKSPLPHLWQAETESFLQSSDTEESFISTQQTGPSNVTRKKRAPLTLQLATRDCLSLLARARDPVGRENISSRRQGGAPLNLQAEKSGPPPIDLLPPTLRQEESFSSFFVVAGESFFLAESSFASWLVASQSWEDWRDLTPSKRRHSTPPQPSKTTYEFSTSPL